MASEAIEGIELYIKLSRILAANERAIEEKMALLLRMESIDHTSDEEDYQAKLQWLSAQGKGGEMKKMIEARGNR
jgi:hypothetical protein